MLLQISILFLNYITIILAFFLSELIRKKQNIYIHYLISLLFFNIIFNTFWQKNVYWFYIIEDVSLVLLLGVLFDWIITFILAILNLIYSKIKNIFLKSKKTMEGENENKEM